MLSTDPVTRLSRTTTSSPRSNNRSHRCDPRKPPPPLTTTRAIRPTYCRSRAADPPVLEPAPPQRLSVEQVAAVDDARLRECVGDLVEVEPAELVPLRQHQQHFCSRAGGVGIGGDLDAVEHPGLARFE